MSYTKNPKDKSTKKNKLDFLDKIKFFSIPPTIFKYKLNPTEILFVSIVFHFKDTNNGCYLSNEQFYTMMGVSKNTFLRTKVKIISSGFVTVKEKSKGFWTECLTLSDDMRELFNSPKMEQGILENSAKLAPFEYEYSPKLEQNGAKLEQNGAKLEPNNCINNNNNNNVCDPYRSSARAREENTHTQKTVEDKIQKAVSKEFMDTATLVETLKPHIVHNDQKVSFVRNELLDHIKMTGEDLFLLDSYMRQKRLNINYANIASKTKIESVLNDYLDQAKKVQSQSKESKSEVFSNDYYKKSVEKLAYIEINGETYLKKDLERLKETNFDKYKQLMATGDTPMNEQVSVAN
jgi:hypothetical protein